MASNIAEFLKHKNILITGSTGFLAKIFIEKILREQPFVGCLFVLIRAPDLKSAKDRLKNEVIYKELFKILREQQGKDYESFMFERVVPVVGDTTFDNLGITDQSVREELWDKLDILVNTAANTTFDESMASFRRYMGLRFKIPLEALGVANKLLCQMFARRYNYLLRKYNFVMYLAELYEPYSFFQGRFNSTNTERLLNTMTSADRKRFDFDAKCIDWVHYFLNIHIPGVIKYVLK